MRAKKLETVLSCSALCIRVGWWSIVADQIKIVKLADHSPILVNGGGINVLLTFLLMNVVAIKKLKV